MESEDPENVKEYKPKKWPTLLAASGATQGAFALGTVLAWPSPTLPELIEKKTFGELTTAQTSWIASLAILGAAFSAIPAGYCMERIGRRKTLMTISVPLFIGWMLIVFADSVGMLYLGRFITGFASGACSLVVPTYLSEIATDKHRGKIGSFFTTQVVHGILFVYLHAIIVDSEKLSLAASGCSIALLIFMYFMPESPVYLLSQGDVEEATKALKWLRRPQEDSQLEPELKLLQKVAEESTQQDVKFSALGKSIWYPLGICIAFMIFQQWSGLLVAISYTAEIFASAGSSLSPNVSAIIVGVGQMVGVAIAGLLIDRLGRRVLLIGSCLGVIVAWIALGAVFYAKEQNGGVTPDSLKIVPLISLVGFIFVFSLGIGPIAWMLPAELLPANVRGRVGAIAITLNWFPAFILVKVYDDLAGAIGAYSCFWIFASVSLIGAVFTYFILPETKGKSQEEIRSYFESKTTPEPSKADGL